MLYNIVIHSIFIIYVGAYLCIYLYAWMCLWIDECLYRYAQANNEVFLSAEHIMLILESQSTDTSIQISMYIYDLYSYRYIMKISFVCTYMNTTSKVHANEYKYGYIYIYIRIYHIYIYIYILYIARFTKLHT